MLAELLAEKEAGICVSQGVRRSVSPRKWPAGMLADVLADVLAEIFVGKDTSIEVAGMSAEMLAEKEAGWDVSRGVSGDVS